MPLKPLPKVLVERLKKAAPVLERHLGSMENIDWRDAFKTLPRDTTFPGKSLRGMRVGRNFPGVRLAIKRSRTDPAKKVVEVIKQKVTDHNRLFKPSNYVLLMPHAYPLSEKLIAMERVDFPTVQEIEGSQKGRDYFEKFKQEHGVGEKEFRDAFVTLCMRANLVSDHVFLAGYKDGKFLFLPVMDLW